MGKALTPTERPALRVSGAALSGPLTGVRGHRLPAWGQLTCGAAWTGLWRTLFFIATDEAEVFFLQLWGCLHKADNGAMRRRKHINYKRPSLWPGMSPPRSNISHSGGQVLWDLFEETSPAAKKRKVSSLPQMLHFRLIHFHCFREQRHVISRWSKQ